MTDITTMDEVVNASTSQPRSMMWLFLSFAGVALLLAAIGTYGVVSYTTTQRTFEIGVRVALVSSRANIFGLVIRQSLELVVARGWGGGGGGTGSWPIALHLSVWNHES